MPRRRAAVYLEDIQGLDIQAKSTLQVGDEIAGAVVDEMSDDSTSGTMSEHGQVFGPLSLANAACRKCANARFKVRRDGVWVITLTKRVERGTSIRVPYAQHVCHGEPLVCACGTPLDDDVSEGPRDTDDAE